MKTARIIFLAISCLACSKQPDVADSKEFDFSYTIDTVMVDPGEGFIYLKRWLNTAALSPDKKRLFNYNPDASEFEILDLEELKLESRIKMEKEGPLGTGDPRGVVINEEGKFFFTSFKDVREFNAQLDSMKIYIIRSEKFEPLNSDEALSQDYQVSSYGKYLFVPYGPDDYKKPNKGLAIVTLDDLQLKKIPMDLWERSQAYVTTFLQDGEAKSWTNEFVFVDPVDHYVLLSSRNFNEVYILDLTTDSISHKIFHSNLTQDRKKIPIKTTTDSSEEMRFLLLSLNDEVEFSKFYYDDHHDKFWRFSRELDHKIGDSSVFKQVITLFDKDLNQLHEEVTPASFSGYKFFKDGKLWSYVNVEDELGFAVFTFDF